MGNSNGFNLLGRRRTVHPHVHGELRNSWFPLPGYLGSSPRAWGTLITRWCNITGARFIPTCMGNSTPRFALRGLRPVHPHVHGELSNRRRRVIDLRGSSPRAWGTREGYLDLEGVARFIPTCMGNSIFIHPTHRLLPVHPHVHGELRTEVRATHVVPGSSPRAWGTHLRRLRGPAQVRFIPTCMGNSRASPSPGRSRTVHPHVHGELLSAAVAASFACGSSPRAWGTHVSTGNARSPPRFIPTCMGNSST